MLLQWVTGVQAGTQPGAGWLGSPARQLPGPRAGTATQAHFTLFPWNKRLEKNGVLLLSPGPCHHSWGCRSRDRLAAALPRPAPGWLQRRDGSSSDRSTHHTRDWVQLGNSGPALPTYAAAWVLPKRVVTSPDPAPTAEARGAGGRASSLPCSAWTRPPGSSPDQRRGTKDSQKDATQAELQLLKYQFAFILPITQFSLLVLSL